MNRHPPLIKQVSAKRLTKKELNELASFLYTRYEAHKKNLQGAQLQANMPNDTSVKP